MPLMSALSQSCHDSEHFASAAKCQGQTFPATRAARLGKKRMRGAARTPSLDIRQGGLQVLFGQRDSELIAKHTSIVVFAFEGPAFDSS